MRGSGALLVIVLGLLILWLGITGKFDCFSGALNCMLTRPGGQSADATGAAPPIETSSLQRVLEKTGPQLSLDSFLLSGRTPPFVES